MALAAGSTLGPFTIFDLLGKGGMASVYKAYEAEVGRYVALKVLPQEVLHLDSYVKRFERDARILARLEHPNIVPLYRYGVDDGIPWMSLRMLPVGSLVDLLKEGRLDRRRIVAILKQVAEALDHAHGNGVIHRDVKPGNVLLDDKDRPYLCDFGIAHLDEATEVLTLTGMMAGSPRYMAPEQSESMDVDHRADIYALGIVAYEMLTGGGAVHRGYRGGPGDEARPHTAPDSTTGAGARGTDTAGAEGAGEGPGGAVGLRWCLRGGARPRSRRIGDQPDNRRSTGAGRDACRCGGGHRRGTLRRCARRTGACHRTRPALGTGCAGSQACPGR